jgi:branched-chain amino acid transport system permease protein
MEDFLELFVSATASGCIYGLVALSYLVIIRPTSVINFALGEWAASGAFVGVAVLTTLVWPGLEWPWWSALLIVAAFGAVIGYGTERLTVRPLIARGAPELSSILALLGVLVVFREGNTLLFGASPLPSPSPFGFRRILIGPLPGVSQQFLIIGMTGAIFLVAWLFFERTVWGRAFEAVALNRKAAALMGIDLRKVGALSFAAGGAIAAVAGLLVSPLTSAHFLMGLPLAIQGFSALVIGGVGRVEGALLGGLILAFVEQFSARWLPIPSGLTVAFPFALLIFFLLFRPTGLLRAPETRV